MPARPKIVIIHEVVDVGEHGRGKMSWEREGKEGGEGQSIPRDLSNDSREGSIFPCSKSETLKLCLGGVIFPSTITRGGRESKMDTQIFIKSWAGLIPMTIDESTTVKNGLKITRFYTMES